MLCKAMSSLPKRNLHFQAARADLQNQDALIHTNLKTKEYALDEMKMKLLENEELTAKSPA